MSTYPITTQKQIRKLFWATFPNLPHRKITDYRATARCGPPTPAARLRIFSTLSAKTAKSHKSWPPALPFRSKTTMETTTPSRFWLWPDHAISKGESKVLREEHNKLAQEHHDLLAALQAVTACNWYNLTDQQAHALHVARAKATGGQNE